MYPDRGGVMKKLAFLLFLFCAGVFGQSKPQDYPITVHVTASRIVEEAWFKDSRSMQKLNATIDGKKYELESNSNSLLLRIGDYKAKLIEDQPRNGYELRQVYEFQFVDGKTRKFVVVGMEE